MHMEWEINNEDINVVLKEHGVSLTEDQLDDLSGVLDHEEIIDNLMNYCGIDEQTSSMLSDIEDTLLIEGVIRGDKVFFTT